MTVLKSVIIVALMLMSGFMGATMTVPTAYKQGYEKALIDIKDYLNKEGIAFSWMKNGEGYELQAWVNGVLYARGIVRVDLDVELWHLGTLMSHSYHAGVLTNIGKDFIEQQVSGTASTTNAIYIACSADTDTPIATWTVVGGTTTDELNANGFTRATGTYASTGTGAWNVTYTFSATGTQTVKLYGLNWSATSRSDNNLLCADTSTDKNCVNGDTLKVTWQCTVT